MFDLFGLHRFGQLQTSIPFLVFDVLRLDALEG